MRHASDDRPPAHTDLDPAEIGFGGDRVSERKELDLDCAERRTETGQFPRSQILGERLLRFDRRTGRRDDPRLYQEPRISRQAVGPDAAKLASS